MTRLLSPKTKIKVWAVQTVFNTNHEHVPIPQHVSFDNLPVVYHGPFESEDAAKDWMINSYPDGDTDVEDQFYGEFEVEEDWLNDPDGLFS